eukprot:scaffold296789_cov31-Tisochrysis_lutea.AAC.2
MVFVSLMRDERRAKAAPCVSQPAAQQVPRGAIVGAPSAPPFCGEGTQSSPPSSPRTAICHPWLRRNQRIPTKRGVAT